ncbi:30S ribosomal protein S6 [Candidatus Acidianus copahuensis]|uniref:Small ribosomal subunit protein eS6 n=1 Tax=Candidatus Acidianus copahuensis TaxID=1160895 RepID=A0A031LLU2_9CREN|nr:30S ribosomal protein S6e [Candidatus Acidianus copahuensis]EZQ03111.1 30S ribosomal protein S6 [Candidatus Acidianus copahuensis]
MADFKIVISDPASKKVKQMKIKAKADESIQSVEGEKEGKNVPLGKINSKTKQALGVENFVSLSVIRKEGDKIVNVKVHLLVQVDENIPDNEIHVNKTVAEKLGGDELVVTAYRTKAFQLSLDQSKLNLFGIKINDEITLDISGTSLKLKVTGGSDNTGFPMRPDVSGPAKRRILLSDKPGFIPEEDGERRRKTVRGDTISNEIVQINAVILR